MANVNFAFRVEEVNPFVVLDTSAWISCFFEVDRFHREAVEIIEFTLKNGLIFVVPEYVYYEVLVVASRRFGNNLKVNLAIEFFEHSSFCKLKFFERNFFLNLVKKHLFIYNLRTSDYLVLISCIDLKPRAFYTFDKRLGEAYNYYLNSK